ncbi:MAG TPA: LLM class flavin-dependent oxidoreductase [Stellaceae bacterium]|nr:LLM class flavin-dependent oxidoreductase [Stellaceae bacterium]
MLGRNRFKLGLFGLNCSNGMTMTKAPERWEASWENNLRAARLAEEAGLEFLLPIARWRGYAGETDTEGSAFETLTWAAGLLAATREINAFGTLHVAFVNPVFAAKQVVTNDHIGRGRFGLNVVSGWNVDEHAMFGRVLLEHDDRYRYTEEWVTIAKRIWSEDAPFDFKGRYFDLSGVLLKPKPSGGRYPLLMSAGSSEAGRTFAAKHADCLFMVIVDPDLLERDVRSLREMAAGRSVGVYASGHLICRSTRKEAEEYYHYIVHEMGDWEAAEHAVAIRTRGGGLSIPPERLPAMKARFISGTGTFPVIGSYDDAAAVLHRMAQAGLDGMAVGLVNYITEMPTLRDEILPRLERLGLRERAP